MLTISSIGVGPRPQQTPVPAPAPAAPGRVGASVSRDNAGAAVAVPSGDGTGAQVSNLPSTLPPVTGAGEAAPGDLPNNAQVLAPKPPQDRSRFKGELPPEPKNAADEAMDQQIEEFIPNLWKASRAAVEALAPQADTVAPAETPVTTSASKDTPYVLGDASGKPPATPGNLLDVEA